MATNRRPSFANGGKSDARDCATGNVGALGIAGAIASSDRQVGRSLDHDSRETNQKRAVLAGARRSRSSDDRSAGRGDSRGVEREGTEAANVHEGNNLFVPPRRTRLSNSLDKQTSGWLRRVIRVHARLCEIVSRFGQKPLKRCDELALRIEQGDRTLLHDCVSVAIHELQSVLDAIEASMRLAPPTDAMPGSAAKIEVLRQRFADSQELFVNGDTATLDDSRVGMINERGGECFG